MPGGTQAFSILSSDCNVLTFDGNCVEQRYSVQPAPSCTTVSLNTPFNKTPHHNHI